MHNELEWFTESNGIMYDTDYKRYIDKSGVLQLYLLEKARAPRHFLLGKGHPMRTL